MKSLIQRTSVGWASRLSNLLSNRFQRQADQTRLPSSDDWEDNWKNETRVVADSQAMVIGNDDRGGATRRTHALFADAGELVAK